jgi:hypothetical protein
MRDYGILNAKLAVSSEDQLSFGKAKTGYT